MIRLEMKKIQYDINRESVKTPALSSGKIDRWGYLTGEKILASDQRSDRTSYIYLFSFRKSFRKTNKNDWRSRQKANEHDKQLIKPSCEKDSLELVKRKIFFDELVNKKRFEIN